MKLGIVIASTRPGRAGLPIANWFTPIAEKHGKFEIEVMDLANPALPLLDEPHHPRLQKYEHAHTKAWSARVKEKDAFVLVTPEYNHSAPPALTNAIDSLVHEWAYKPAAFVSYGGVSGCSRSAAVTKMTLVTLKVVPIVESVTIPFFTKHMTPEGTFAGSEDQAKAANAMLDELHKWAAALKPMRG